jgi:hypothetical protein
MNSRFEYDYIACNTLGNKTLSIIYFVAQLCCYKGKVVLVFH